MPSRDHIPKAFERINVWSRGSERAPHKPLLVLYALGQLSRGGSNTIAFRDVAPKLTELLREFGPSRKSYRPEYPFWRLQNDGVWIVDYADQLERRTDQTDIPKRELLDKEVHAFPYPNSRTPSSNVNSVTAVHGAVRSGCATRAGATDAMSEMQQAVDEGLDCIERIAGEIEQRSR